MKFANAVFLVVIPGVAQADIVQVKLSEMVVAVGRDGTNDGTTIHLKTCSGKNVEFSAVDHTLNKGDSDCRPVVENRLPAQLGISKETATWRVSNVERFSNYFPSPTLGDSVQATVDEGSIKLTYRDKTVTIK